MKAFGIVLKILAALAAVAGIVYVVAAYGDKIVAWTRKLVDGCCCCCDCDDCEDCDCECCCEEVPCEEAPVAAVETVAEAEDNDFEN